MVMQVDPLAAEKQPASKDIDLDELWSEASVPLRRNNKGIELPSRAVGPVRIPLSPFYGSFFTIQ